MRANPFQHHRQAALALLQARDDIPHKAAGFLGHVCVAPEISERQRGWHHLQTVLFPASK